MSTFISVYLDDMTLRLSCNLETIMAAIQCTNNINQPGHKQEVVIHQGNVNTRLDGLLYNCQSRLTDTIF